MRAWIKLQSEVDGRTVNQIKCADSLHQEGVGSIRCSRAPDKGKVAHNRAPLDGLASNLHNIRGDGAL